MFVSCCCEIQEAYSSVPLGFWWEYKWSGQAWVQAWLSLMEMIPATGQWVKRTTSAVCALAMGLRQAVASHLHEGLFRCTNEAPSFTWTCEASAWFHGFLLTFSSPKQVRQQIPNPTYRADILSWKEKGQGEWAPWRLEFGDSFSLPFTGCSSQQTGLRF